MSRTTDRCDVLFKELDMKLNFATNTYIGANELNSDFNVHWTEITCDDDKQWDEKISKMKKIYNERLIEVENQPDALPRL